jgi:hypothetical protein
VPETRVLSAQQTGCFRPQVVRSRMDCWAQAQHPYSEMDFANPLVREDFVRRGLAGGIQTGHWVANTPAVENRVVDPEHVEAESQWEAERIPPEPVLAARREPSTVCRNKDNRRLGPDVLHRRLGFADKCSGFESACAANIKTKQNNSSPEHLPTRLFYFPRRL